jgi:thiol-disulfide isomerase/thioredoxin
MEPTMCGIPGSINLGLVATLIVATFLTFFTAGSLADDLQGYKPVYSLGSGKDDWWIKYPDQSSNASAPVNHLPWVIDALKEKPVIILVHSTDCKACKVQKKDLDQILSVYGNDLDYYDITADVINAKVLDVLNAYYPNAGIPMVPTTVIFTLVKDSDGKVTVGWHSMDDAMGKDVLTSYVNDAIYYYRQDAANWNK